MPGVEFAASWTTILAAAFNEAIPFTVTRSIFDSVVAVLVSLGSDVAVLVSVYVGVTVGVAVGMVALIGVNEPGW